MNELFKTSGITGTTGEEAPRPGEEIADQELEPVAEYSGVPLLSEAGISSARLLARPGQDPVPALIDEAMRKQDY